MWGESSFSILAICRVNKQAIVKGRALPIGHLPMAMLRKKKKRKKRVLIIHSLKLLSFVSHLIRNKDYALQCMCSLFMVVNLQFFQPKVHDLPLPLVHSKPLFPKCFHRDVKMMPTYYAYKYDLQIYSPLYPNHFAATASSPLSGLQCWEVQRLLNHLTAVIGSHSEPVGSRSEAMTGSCQRHFGLWAGSTMWQSLRTLPQSAVACNNWVLRPTLPAPCICITWSGKGKIILMEIVWTGTPVIENDGFNRNSPFILYESQKQTFIILPLANSQMWCLYLLPFLGLLFFIFTR